MCVQRDFFPVLVTIECFIISESKFQVNLVTTPDSSVLLSICGNVNCISEKLLRDVNPQFNCKRFRYLDIVSGFSTKRAQGSNSHELFVHRNTGGGCRMLSLPGA